AAGSGVPSASGSAGPSALGFDAATGLLAIRPDAGGAAVREALGPAGFLELTAGGRLHSSDPASASFDPALAGATGATLPALRFDGGPGTLVLGPQSLPGSLPVRAGGADVVTEDVAVGGRLAVQASAITVRGALRAGAVDLAGWGWVTVEAAGRVAAGRGDGGGRGGGAAGGVVHAGQLHAQGPGRGAGPGAAAGRSGSGPATS